MNQAFYSVSDVARLLDVHRKTVLLWIDRGQLSAMRVGRLIRVSQAALDALTAPKLPRGDPPRRAGVESE